MEPFALAWAAIFVLVAVGALMTITSRNVYTRNDLAGSVLLVVTSVGLVWLDGIVYVGYTLLGVGVIWFAVAIEHFIVAERLDYQKNHGNRDS